MLDKHSSQDLAELGQSPRGHGRQNPAHRKHLATRRSTAGPGDNCRQVSERVALSAHHQATTVELVHRCARATKPMTEVQPQIAVRENQFRPACSGMTGTFGSFSHWATQQMSPSGVPAGTGIRHLYISAGSVLTRLTVGSCRGSTMHLTTVNSHTST